MAESIYDFIDQMLAEENEASEQEITVDSDVPGIASVGEAERSLWYYKNLQLEIQQMHKQAEDYVKEAQLTAERYLQKNCAYKERLLGVVEQRLRNFTEAETARTGKKSVKLVNGTMSLTKQQPKYERDEEVILHYITTIADSDNPLVKFLKPQPDKLDWAGIKKAGTVKEIDGVKHLVVGKVTVPTVTVIDQDKVFKIK